MAGRIWTVVSLVLLLPALASAQRTRLAFVSVQDQAGTPVTNLTAADFDLSIGGVKQTVTHVAASPPLRVVLLVDASQPVTHLLTTFRAGLHAFFDALPADIEVAFLSIGGQLRIRQAPTTDRVKLHAAAATFQSDGGNNPFLDVLLESDRRFLRNAENRWPVFVIVTTDEEGLTGGGSEDIEGFNAFVHDFVARGGSAHALVLHSPRSGMISDLAQNLVENTGGLHDGMAISNALPDKLRTIAARVATDHRAMANSYELRYRVSTDSTAPLELRVARDGLVIKVSQHRPF